MNAVKFLFGFGQFFFKRTVKIVKNFKIGLLAVLDTVEFCFHICGKAHIDYIFEVVFHHIGRNFAYRGRVQNFAVSLDIMSFDNGRNGGCISRGSAYSVIFKRLDKRALGVSRRRLSELLFALKFLERKRLSFFKIRQSAGFFLFVFGIIVKNRKALLTEFGIRCPEHAVVCRNIHGHGVVNGGCHLRSDKTLPNKFIKSVLLGRHRRTNSFGRQFNGRRAYRFVRILRICF